MKKILILWTIIAVILVSALTVIGLKLKGENKYYKELEHKLTKGAEGYYGMHIDELANNAVLNYNDLNKTKYSVEMFANGDKCTGYIEVKEQRGMYKYNAYIKCSKYTSKDYDSTKDYISNTCSDDEQGC